MIDCLSGFISNRVGELPWLGRCSRSSAGLSRSPAPGSGWPPHPHPPRRRTRLHRPSSWRRSVGADAAAAGTVVVHAESGFLRRQPVRDQLLHSQHAGRGAGHHARPARGSPTRSGHRDRHFHRDLHRQRGQRPGQLHRGAMQRRQRRVAVRQRRQRRQRRQWRQCRAIGNGGTGGTGSPRKPPPRH